MLHTSFTALAWGLVAPHAVLLALKKHIGLGLHCHKIGNWPNWGKLGAPPLGWGTMGVVVGAHTMTWPTVGSRMLGEALGPLGWLLQACCKLPNMEMKVF